MAQRVGHSATKRLLRLLQRVPRSVLVFAAFAVVAFVAVGAALASGESFHIERAGFVEVGERAVDGFDEDAEAPVAAGGVDADAGGAAGGVDADAAQAIVVDVDGAVMKPGVVELPAGSRVADAVAAAGGLAADANTQALNQAAPLSDGEKVYVPREGDAAPAAGSGGAVGGVPAATGGSATVNINTATIDELDELPGVGPATARAIVDEREENGPFTTPEDLMRVSGIGEKKFEKLADLISV